MEVLYPIIAFFLQNTLILFIVAFGMGLGARHFLSRGDAGKAKVMATIAFMAASLLAVIYAGITMLTSNAVNLLFAALWGYFAWRDWQLLKMLRGG